MAVEYWKANKEIQEKVQHLIGQHHPDLAIICAEVVAVFREKAGKTGGQVVLGNSKRVAALANALGGTEFKFVLELAADQWEQELTSKQQEALLDHLLTACRCEEDPKSGDFKLSVAKPDIMAFTENVDRYGMWFPREADEEPTPVEQLFQEKPDESDDLLDEVLDGA